MGNEWECHKKPDHVSMWLKNKYIHICYDVDTDKFWCQPIQNQPELEGIIDSTNLLKNNDIIIDIEHGKTYIVEVKNITQTKLLELCKL